MTEDRYTLALDPETGKSMSLYLYRDVVNTKEIRKKLMSGKISCCVIKALLVVDPFQVAVAANKAALREKRSKLTTKSIFTEVLYCMSTSSKITESLIKFGIHDDDTNIVVVSIYDDTTEQEKMEKEVLTQINGTKTTISRIGEFTDEEKIKEVYKIEGSELLVSDLLNSVVSRISMNAV